MEIVQPDQQFAPEDHFFPAALIGSVHPTLKKLLYTNNASLAQEYCDRNQDADYTTLLKLMNRSARHYQWGGADLIQCVDMEHQRKMVVIEMNECCVGNDSMPFNGWGYEGFRRVIVNTFLPRLDQPTTINGGLAVFYSKHHSPEASAFSCMLAKITGEQVFLVDLGYSLDLPSFVRWTDDGICQLDVSECGTDLHPPAYTNEVPKEDWRNLKAIFRVGSGHPWLKLRILSKTIVINPVESSLAGGKNKQLAAQAYQSFNNRYAKHGLQINTPLTITNMAKAEIPNLATTMNHQLVVKIPYSSRGVGVFTITSQEELASFMARSHYYEKFIVQGLISHPSWPLSGSPLQLHHVGRNPSSPDDQGDMYVADFRIIICSGRNGWMPVAMFSRLAARPLRATLDPDRSSWEMLGTNLSVGEDTTIAVDENRLMVFDEDTFDKLGLDFYDLVECYVQTVLAATAIDELSMALTTASAQGPIDGFNLPLFHALNDDSVVLDEIKRGFPQLAKSYPALFLPLCDKRQHENGEHAKVKAKLMSSIS